jgi:transposase-like protein
MGRVSMRIIKDCTESAPFSKEKDSSDTRWRHHGAEEVGYQESGYPGGDIQRYRCRFCGVEWKEELPQ